VATLHLTLQFHTIDAQGTHTVFDTRSNANQFLARCFLYVLFPPSIRSKATIHGWKDISTMYMYLSAFPVIFPLFAGFRAAPNLSLSSATISYHHWPLQNKATIFLCLLSFGFKAVPFSAPSSARHLAASMAPGAMHGSVNWDTHFRAFGSLIPKFHHH
jgi:hypothetical protein